MTDVQTQHHYHQPRQRGNFRIHHDRHEIEESDHEDAEIDDQPQDISQDEANVNDQNDAPDSDSSSDGEIDEATHEDMQKLEQSFNELEGRFRLIKRIGEGILIILEHATLSNQLICQRHLLHCLQSRGLAIRPIPKRLGHRPQIHQRSAICLWQPPHIRRKTRSTQICGNKEDLCYQ